MKLSSSAVKQFEQDFKKAISDNAKEIDPDNEQDWYSLTLGFAIGMGFSPEVSHELALHIRYNTQLG